MVPHNVGFSYSHLSIDVYTFQIGSSVKTNPVYLVDGLKQIFARLHIYEKYVFCVIPIVFNKILKLTNRFKQI